MMRMRLFIALLVWVWSASAWAAPAHVQSPAAATAFSGTSIALPFGSNVTAGSLLVCHIYANHGISSVADSLAQTFSSAVNVTDGATFSIATFYVPNSAAGADTVTVTFAGTIAYASLQCAEYSGVATSSPLDQAVSQNQTDPGTGTDAVTSGNVTTTTDGQLIVGWSTALVVGAGTLTAGTGYTGRTNVFNDTLHEDRVQTTAGSIAATFTSNSATSDFVTQIATFKAAAAPSGCGGRLMLLGVGSC